MKLLLRTIAAGALVLGAHSAVAEETFITIGTGGQTGVYYVVGQSICRLVNRGTAEHNIKCTAPSTGGSIDNINAIKNGDRQMGVAQSDWQFHAYNGSSQFEGDKFDKLRAVFSVHGEPFTVVARADAGVKNFDDLKGKRVNIGNPGSGQRATMDVVMNAKGWTLDDFALASELKAAEQSAALCDNQIDAMVYTVGHPSGSIQEATTACDSVLVEVSGDAVTALVKGGDRKILIDLSPVVYIDSASIGCLMDLYRQSAAAGGTLKLSGVQKRVETMLTMTGAHQFIEVHADERSALETFGV